MGEAYQFEVRSLTNRMLALSRQQLCLLFNCTQLLNSQLNQQLKRSEKSGRPARKWKLPLPEKVEAVHRDHYTQILTRLKELVAEREEIMIKFSRTCDKNLQTAYRNQLEVLLAEQECLIELLKTPFNGVFPQMSLDKIQVLVGIELIRMQHVRNVQDCFLGATEEPENS